VPFKKGTPKLGGRSKGTPNKATLARLEILKAASEDFASKLREHHIDPIKGIADTLPLLDPPAYCQVMLALCKYKYPTLKPIDPKKPENPYSGLTKLELLEQMRTGVALLEEQISEEAKGERVSRSMASEAPGEDE
jgi:hypothetical protein